MSVLVSALAADAFDQLPSKFDAMAIDSPIAWTPDVTVVVPTYRRPAMLERCLASLLTQDYDPVRFEIIVCDDGPDEATRAECEVARREAGASMKPPHCYYPRAFFERFATEHARACRVFDQQVPGYGNSRFRFNALL